MAGTEVLKVVLYRENSVNFPIFYHVKKLTKFVVVYSWQTDSVVVQSMSYQQTFYSEKYIE